MSCGSLFRPGRALVATHFELAFAHDPDLDLVTFLQLERLDDRRRESNREAVERR